MSKSISIIDTLKACIWCPFFRENCIACWCVAIPYSIVEMTDRTIWGHKTSRPRSISSRFKSKKCPLKPLPQKKVSSLVVDGEKVNSAYEEGWNDCIDEILGGQNEQDE